MAGGVESMTRAPVVMAKAARGYGAPPEMADTTLGWRLVNPRHARRRRRQGHDQPRRDGRGGRAPGPDLARGVGRLGPPLAAAHGRGDEQLKADLVPVPLKDGELTEDEVPRPSTTTEALAKLNPSFERDGIVTAGTASPLSDGAGAIVVASEKAVERHGLQPRGRVVATASAGVPPHIMGLGPVPSTEKVLARTGWKVGDLDAVEINEAFATQVIASIRRLGLDEETVNAEGGAIALGHPLGASGVRLVIGLLGRLEREGGSRGLATLCVGVGQGMAMLVEKA